MQLLNFDRLIMDQIASKYKVTLEDVKSLSDDLKKVNKLDVWVKAILEPKSALLVIDMQHDFISGSLAIGDAESIISPCSQLAKESSWYKVIFSQDWHPQNHSSFHSQLDTSKLDPSWRDKNTGEINMFDKVLFKGTPPMEQVLWPDHCVQNSHGAEFHDDILPSSVPGAIIQRKGMNPEMDSYSAFFDNTRVKGAGNTGLENKMEGVTEVVVIGLATDYCVAFTALDALSLGLPTTFLQDLTKPVCKETEKIMIEKVRSGGGIVTTLAEWRKEGDSWARAKAFAHFFLKSS